MLMVSVVVLPEQIVVDPLIVATGRSCTVTVTTFEATSLQTPLLMITLKKVV
jgi:hypothetical protein